MTSPLKAALAAPSVKEADGAVLRPDMMPLGPTVQIPRYENSAAGDRIALTWTGGASIEAHWSGELVLATADEACIFHVPFVVLSAAESYEVTTCYELRRTDGTVESSAPANFSVRNYPPTGLIQTYDEHGLPTGSFKYDAEFFDAQLSDDFALSLKAGDQVIFWLRGLLGLAPSPKLAAACEHVVLTIPGPKDLPQGVNPTRHTFNKSVIRANYGSELLLS